MIEDFDKIFAIFKIYDFCLMILNLKVDLKELGFWPFYALGATCLYGKTPSWKNVFYGLFRSIVR